MPQTKLSLAIHELNTWGGQDRSTLEIAKHLSHSIPISAYVYDIQNIDLPAWGEVEFHKVSPHIKKPAFARFLYYYLKTFMPLKSNHLVQATGASSLVSDIVQVQYIHTTWKKKQKEFGLEETVPGSLPKQIYHKLLTQFNIATEKVAFKPTKTYIAISESIRDELEDAFSIPRQQIKVIHHGVDTQAFHPAQQKEETHKMRQDIRHKLGIPDDEIAFVFVGAFNHRKGVAPLIKAFAQLDSPCHLILVGGGSPAPYQEMVETKSKKDRIHFITHQKDILPYYWASDTFILPSLYEPFGLVALEAMSCGLPVLISRSAGSAELITEGEHGYLFEDPTDENEIAKKIQELLLKQDQLKQMSEDCRKKAEASDWSLVAQRYLDVIQEVSSKKS